MPWRMPDDTTKAVSIMRSVMELEDVTGTEEAVAWSQAERREQSLAAANALIAHRFMMRDLLGKHDAKMSIPGQYEILECQTPRCHDTRLSSMIDSQATRYQCLTCGQKDMKVVMRRKLNWRKDLDEQPEWEDIAL